MLRRNAQATIIGDSDASRETGLVAEKIGLMLAKHGTISLILTKQAYPISYRQSTQFKLDWGYSSFFKVIQIRVLDV